LPQILQISRLVGLRAGRGTIDAMMKRQLAAYVGTMIVMVGLDMLWLGVIAKPIYQQGIGHLMADKPNVPVAVLFYALYGLGLVVFAVLPAGPAPGWGKTLGMAALFGLFAYATYDLTNLATLKQWPIGLSVIDMAWGTCISAAAAAGGKALMDWAAPL
jgi:uncharacterized membrane protein